MRRRGKKYLVIISEDEKCPMKQWLRENRQHVPEGKDPDDPKINSVMWRIILKRNGWEDRETTTEVHLIFPTAETPILTPTHLKGLSDMRRPGKTYLVIIPGKGRYPMQQWLRDNRQHAPDGMDPYDKKINSQTWRRVLRRNGWGDEETDTEVRLIFPAEDEGDDGKTPMEGLPDMRRVERRYFVVLSEEEKYPMKEWLRDNPEYLPEGMHPDTHTSQQLRYGLKRNGWEDKVTDSEVHLIFPAEDEEDDVETPSAFALEQHLRDYIAKDIQKISFNGRNLKLFQDQDGRKGVEYPTDTGRIDILAISATDNQEFFVIELKLSRGSDQAIGQLMRYMTWVEDRLTDDRQVKGIIVAQSIDDKLKRSVRMISSRVELLEYKLKFDLTPVSLTLD